MSDENNTETQETCSYPCCKNCPCMVHIATDTGEEHMCGIILKRKEKGEDI